MHLHLYVLLHLLGVKIFCYCEDLTCHPVCAHHHWNKQSCVQLPTTNWKFCLAWIVPQGHPLLLLRYYAWSSCLQLLHNLIWKQKITNEQYYRTTERESTKSEKEVPQSLTRKKKIPVIYQQCSCSIYQDSCWRWWWWTSCCWSNWHWNEKGFLSGGYNEEKCWSLEKAGSK